VHDFDPLNANSIAKLSPAAAKDVRRIGAFLRNGSRSEKSTTLCGK
jgi:hypothetical protein